MRSKRQGGIGFSGIIVISPLQGIIQSIIVRLALAELTRTDLRQGLLPRRRFDQPLGCVYSLSRKTVNARENFWNVYCFATNQMLDETAKDNRQTAAGISHDLI